MKTRRLATWVAGPILAAVIIPGALAQTTATLSAAPEPKAPLKAALAQPSSNATSSTAVRVLAPAIPALSPWAEEMAKLAHAGIEESVMLSFIDNAAGTFNLSPEQIIYLRDLGLPNDVINAMMQHDSELAGGVYALPTSTLATTPQEIRDFLASFKSVSPTSAKAPTVTSTPQLAVAPPALPAPQQFAALDIPTFWEETEPSQISSEPAGLYPVREPYPVKLTDPILVIRGEGRVPNVFILQGFP